VSGIRIVVHPAHVRVAKAMAELIGEVEVVANRHVPLGDVYLISVPEIVEYDYESFRTQVSPTIPLLENRCLITKIA
jgi:hypothetical protein